MNAELPGYIRREELRAEELTLQKRIAAAEDAIRRKERVLSEGREKLSADRLRRAQLENAGAEKERMQREKETLCARDAQLAALLKSLQLMLLKKLLWKKKLPLKRKLPLPMKQLKNLPNKIEH